MPGGTHDERSSSTPTAPARAIPAPAAGARCSIAGGRVKELSGGELATTNNRMELTAVIRALEALTPGRDVDALHRFAVRQERDRDAGSTAGSATAGRPPTASRSRTPSSGASSTRQAARHRVRWHWVRGHSDDAGQRARRRAGERGVDEVQGDQRLTADAARVRPRRASLDAREHGHLLLRLPVALLAARPRCRFDTPRALRPSRPASLSALPSSFHAAV